MNKGMKVLIVDADPRRGAALASELRAYGHECDVSPPAEALERVATKQYSIAITDYTEGGRDFLLSYKRVDPVLPVIVATHVPSVATSREFLSGGPLAAAVDYIALPEVNLGRIVAERVAQHYGRVVAGEFIAERAAERSTYRGEPIDLTPTEFKLLMLFMQRAFTDVTYEEMARFIYNEDMDGEAAFFRLKSHIHRLRRTLRKLTGRQDILARRKTGTLRFSPGRPPVGLS